MPAAAAKNGVMVARIIGVVFAVALLAILSLAFTNQMVMAGHISVKGPHGEINDDLATLKTDVEWIRRHLEGE